MSHLNAVGSVIIGSSHSQDHEGPGVGLPKPPENDQEVKIITADKNPRRRAAVGTNSISDRDKQQSSALAQQSSQLERSNDLS